MIVAEGELTSGGRDRRPIMPNNAQKVVPNNSQSDNATDQGSLATLTERRLSRAEFQGLGEMPPELEWFANLDNPRTRRAYRIDVKEFTAFAGVERPEEMRQVTRAHLIAWRKDLERRGLAKSSIRRKLAAIASLFDHLCEEACEHRPARPCTPRRLAAAGRVIEPELLLEM